MNPVSLAMDGLLAVLLLTAVAVGVRLSGKLKLLREGQGQFVKAVGDLDAAAARAEAGLQTLRAATEEAHDALLNRIETARGLLPKLDRASQDGAATCARLDAAVDAGEAAARRAGAATDSAVRTTAELTVAAQAAVDGAARRAAPPAPALAPSLRARAATGPTPELFTPGEDDAPTAYADAPRRSRAAAEPIPFPSAGRASVEQGLAAALRAAERIVEAEVEPAFAPSRRSLAAQDEPLAFPPPRPAPASPAAGDDRLSRFVARRRSARG